MRAEHLLSEEGAGVVARAHLRKEAPALWRKVLAGGLGNTRGHACFWKPPTKTTAGQIGLGLWTGPPSPSCEDLEKSLSPAPSLYKAEEALAQGPGGLATGPHPLLELTRRKARCRSRQNSKPSREAES